jgi:hypothetical protein
MQSRNIIFGTSLSTIAGAALAAVGAYVATSHVGDTGIKALMWGIAAGAVIAAPRIARAWATGQHAAAVLAVVAIAAAELFGLVNAAERMLADRAVAASLAEKGNRASVIAIANEEAARAALDRARNLAIIGHAGDGSLRASLARIETAITDETRNRGCKTVCLGLKTQLAETRGRLAADIASGNDRLRLEVEAAEGKLRAAETELKAAPAALIESHLAAATGLPRWVVDLVPSLLASIACNVLAFALLAMGHSPAPAVCARSHASVGWHAPASARTIPALPAPPRNRDELVRAIVADLEARGDGFPVAPSEVRRAYLVRTGAALPKASAHRIMRRVGAA